jgi:hypothetical protein
MSEIENLLREQTGIYVENNVDRFTVIFSGQPRFVGNRNWVDNVLGFFRDTKEQFPNIPLDIFCIAWEYDVINNNWFDPAQYNIRQTGFPTSEYRHKSFNEIKEIKSNIIDRVVEIREGQSHGKISAKFGEFEDYIRKAFHFADLVKVCWYDPYTQYMLLDKVFSEKSGEEVFTPYGYNWQMQNFIMKRMYEDNREYFDKTLTENSVIYKTRYDVGYPHFKWNRQHNENLGNISTVLHQFQYDHITRPSRPEFYKRNDTYRGITLSPMVVLQQDPIKIIRGSISSNDYTYAFDKQGFIDYAVKYWDWAFEKYNRISVSEIRFRDFIEIEGSPELHNFKLKPESATPQFFIDNNFTITSILQPHLWANNFNDYARPVVDLYRFLYKDDYDLHRFRFYHYPKDIIDDLFVIDNDAVELSYYIP